MGANSEETLAFLHSRGITTKPTVLRQMLEEVIDKLPATAFHRDPRRELSASDAAELEEAGFDLEPKDYGKDDPLARTVTLYAGILATALSVQEASKLLGVNSSRIRQRLSSERTLYGIKSQSQWLVPAFQFHGGKLIPGVDQVFPSLPESLNPVAVLMWFQSPNPDLEVELDASSAEARNLSPRDWLLSGHDPKAAAALAKDL